jgi:ribosomal protein S18 acetylase RimI-like enzyme
LSVQYPGLEFQVRVLEDNPSISWYESLGFEKRKKLENYWVLVHKK